MLVSVDPGLRHCGYGIFDKTNRKLLSCGLVKNTIDPKVRGPVAWKQMAKNVYLEIQKFYGLTVFFGYDLVIEIPKVYPGRGKGDPADLIELAGVDGALAAYLEGKVTVGYLPRQWKGQVPKEIHNKRIVKELWPLELELLPDLPKSLIHNVIDAVGIGLFHLGRLK